MSELLGSFWLTSLLRISQNANKYPHTQPWFGILIRRCAVSENVANPVHQLPIRPPNLKLHRRFFALPKQLHSAFTSSLNCLRFREGLLLLMINILPDLIYQNHRNHGIVVHSTSCRILYTSTVGMTFHARQQQCRRT